MAYDPAALDESLNFVRLLIGDTSDPEKLTDEEINHFISAHSSNDYLAAAEAAEAIAAKSQTMVSSKSADGKSISYTNVTDYMDLARRLRARAARNKAGKPYAGGTSKSDKETVERNTDRDAPAIELGMHDQEGTETSPLRSGPIP